MTAGPRRDLIGYAGQPPDPKWPGGARLAVNLGVNYEAGAEYCILNGDDRPETVLSDLNGLEARPGTRNVAIEQAYEYGSRVAVYRLLELFREMRLPFTVYAVGYALELNPAACEALAAADCDLVGHGWRWIDYYDMPEDEERQHIARTSATIEERIGRPPVGWYTGRSSLNTRRLVVEHGGFLYDSDAYNDDLPYWVTVSGRAHLVIPDALDCQDTRFSRAQGFDHADDFFRYMRDSFDWLYAEGERTPRMMTVALHPRLIGRPGRIAGLARFLEHIAAFDDVWICKREEIARHWIATHPAAD